MPLSVGETTEQRLRRQLREAARLLLWVSTQYKLADWPQLIEKAHEIEAEAHRA